MPSKQTLIVISLLFLSQLSISQNTITVEDIYTKGVFYQESVYGINWMNDGSYYSSLENNQILKNDISTGKTLEVLVDGKTLNIANQISEYSFSPDESKVLLLTDPQYIYRRSYSNKSYVYNIATKEIQTLSNKREMYPTFSPNGSKIAYVRDNNIYFKSLNDDDEVQVTFNGKINSIINGGSDWVYEEEFYITKSFYWSPDGTKIAYYSFDESEIQEYTLQRWNEGQVYPENYIYKYPKAGTANSKIKIFVYDIQTKNTKQIDIGSESDIYIPRMQWTKENNLLSIVWLNRLQNHMKILHVDVDKKETNIVYEEKSKTFIDTNFCDDLIYLKDKKHFVFSSEKDGYKHLYRYNMDGSLVNQITKGNWEVEELIAIDENTNKLFYLSKENTPLNTLFYEVNIDGNNKKLLSPNEGSTSINMSPDSKYYISYYSNATLPLQVSLYKTKNNQKIKTLKSNESLLKNAKKFNLVNKEFFKYQTNDGTTLNGYLLKPSSMDSNKKYPLLIYQYSGPGSQNVTNSWGGSHFYWHQMLVQKGYVIAYIDTRGTGGRGAEFKKMTYQQLGKYETEDIIEGAKYLSKMSYIDSNRIGVWGWSYGGFISSLSLLKGNDVFKAGIVVAMVSSYRFYDTVYTERYMNLPQNNPTGYDDNAPLTHAGKLKGKLLLIHGTGDDNVHVQNTIAFQDALISAGKQFDYFTYPDRTHSMYQRNAYPHLFTKMTSFVLNNL